MAKRSIEQVVIPFIDKVLNRVESKGMDREAAISIATKLIVLASCDGRKTILGVRVPAVIGAGAGQSSEGRKETLQ